MSRSILLALLLFFTAATDVFGQHYDLLLKGGYMIDPKNNIDGKMDLAITDGKIAKVATSIPPGDAKKVVDVTGLIVTPGIIDMHVHVFLGTA